MKPRPLRPPLPPRLLWHLSQKARPVVAAAEAGVAVAESNKDRHRLHLLNRIFLMWIL